MMCGINDAAPHYSLSDWLLGVRYSDVEWISLQWNLSVTTTSLIKFITCDLFSNVF